jgi:hypothetical protein
MSQTRNPEEIDEERMKSIAKNLIQSSKKLEKSSRKEYKSSED